MTRLTRTKEEEVKKLEVAICDLNNQGCCNCPWCDFGTRIDNPAGMREDLKSQMARLKPTLGPEEISQRILTIRGQRVMLDADLAELYGGTTKVLNQAVKRNSKRFPNDFAFRLTAEEKMELVTNCDRFERLKHSTVLPLAFTEHGAIMAASVLNPK